ncbi:16S rRNA (cytosine(1402)-N(4))-methyltransferase RsmH [Pelagibacteraceae bacterium]|jgi:16S rRNA (cytosine1402-N4)-methyltransferase|nr:16S rRNA (cytosine(1402)-N(4))-methyltransferase RsmH [Pelagibacteraceae bacterium]MDC1159027.1 16S rRNA (cytosine(1402)-N(4))-methyltransferase RsmH [Pelagibacteraceae bacterium]
MNNHSSSLEISHFPVMLSEVISISSPLEGGIYLDCTFGGGGYSKQLLKFSKTIVKGLDRDDKVSKIAKKLEKKFPKRFKFYQTTFSQLDLVTKDLVDVIIFDLGLSSIQLNDFKRGFSFKSNKDLDMTMGLNKISAQHVINELSELELKLIIKILGEEKEGAKIAKNIVKSRIDKKIVKVKDLVEIIKKSKKKNYSNKINPCTKTFQAIRIFVNKEITELIYGIINATKILKPGGKLVIISFHSIEDKIIKFFFNNFSSNKSKPSRYLPAQDNSSSFLFENYKNNVLKPSKEEIIQNNRSRSAKLRYAIRSKNKFYQPVELIKKFKRYLDLEGIDV